MGWHLATQNARSHAQRRLLIISNLRCDLLEAGGWKSHEIIMDYKMSTNHQRDMAAEDRHSNIMVNAGDTGKH